MSKKWTGIVLVGLMVAGAEAGVTQRSFGQLNGQAVLRFTLSNKAGMKADIMTWGATVLELYAPDRTGKFEDVVCGFDKLADYPTKSPYFGCIVGRYGNRIAKGKFSIEGKEYRLAVNNGPNSLHGGLKGFDKQNWKAKVISSGDVPKVQFSYVSKNGEEGYPGTMIVQVTYTLTQDNGLRIDYAASTSKTTVANLTSHSYFNLGADDAADNFGHILTINADRFTPVDKDLIPTGELRPVGGTPFDFRKPTAIGVRIDDDDEQLKFGAGYDHNYVLNGQAGTLRKGVNVYEPTTGRNMEVWTTEPGVQLYTGNFLDGSLIGKGGKVYPHRYAFCLETQHFPDSPNHPKFPTTLLKPGTTYRSTTIYKFSAK